MDAELSDIMQRRSSYTEKILSFRLAKGFLIMRAREGLQLQVGRLSIVGTISFNNRARLFFAFSHIFCVFLLKN